MWKGLQLPKMPSYGSAAFGWLLLLLVAVAFLLRSWLQSDDATIEGTSGRPFYIGTIIDAEWVALRDPERLDNVPDPMRAAACRNYRDFLNDVTLVPELTILDDPGLLRSAELLSEDFKDMDVALEVERLLLAEDLSAGEIVPALGEADWSQQDLEVAARYIEARAKPPSADADEKFVVFQTPVTIDTAVVARLEVAPRRELIDEPSVNRFELGLGVELPDGSRVAVDTSLCWK